MVYIDNNMDNFPSKNPETAQDTPENKIQSNFSVPPEEQHKEIILTREAGHLSTEEENKLNKELDSELDEALLSEKGKNFLKNLEIQLREYEQKLILLSEQYTLQKIISSLKNNSYGHTDEEIYLKWKEKIEKLKANSKNLTDPKEIEENKRKIIFNEKILRNYEERRDLKEKFHSYEIDQEDSVFVFELPPLDALITTSGLSLQDAEIIHNKVWTNINDMAFKNRCSFVSKKINHAQYQIQVEFKVPPYISGFSMNIGRLGKNFHRRLPECIEDDAEQKIKEIPESERKDYILTVDSDGQVQIIHHDDYQGDFYPTPFVTSEIPRINPLSKDFIGNENEYAEIEALYYSSPASFHNPVAVHFPLRVENQKPSGINLSYTMGDKDIDINEIKEQKPTSLDDINTYLSCRLVEKFLTEEMVLVTKLKKNLEDMKIGDKMYLGEKYKLSDLTLVWTENAQHGIEFHFENERNDRIIFTPDEHWDEKLNKTYSIRVERPQPSGAPVDFTMTPEILREHTWYDKHIINFLETVDADEASRFVKKLTGRTFTIKNYKYENIKDIASNAEVENTFGQPLQPWEQKIIAIVFARYLTSRAPISMKLEDKGNAIHFETRRRTSYLFDSSDFLHYLPSVFCKPQYEVFVQDDGCVDKEPPKFINIERKREICILPLQQRDGTIVDKEIAGDHITSSDDILFSYQGVRGTSMQYKDKLIQNIYIGYDTESFTNMYYIQFEGESTYQAFPQDGHITIEFLGREPGYFAYLNNDRIVYNKIPTTVHDFWNNGEVNHEDLFKDNTSSIPTKSPQYQKRIRNHKSGYTQPVQEALEQKKQIRVFPNPVTPDGNVTVQFEAPENTSGKLILTNIDGSVQKEIPITIFRGGNTYQLPLHDIPRGGYYIQARNNQGENIDELLTAGKLIIQ